MIAEGELPWRFAFHSFDTFYHGRKAFGFSLAWSRLRVTGRFDLSGVSNSLLSSVCVCRSVFSLSPPPPIHMPQLAGGFIFFMP